MKKFLLCLVVFFCWINVPAQHLVHHRSTYHKKVQPKEETVYITRTGAKYHMDGCSYLRSRIPISKRQATAEGYTACSRCW